MWNIPLSTRRALGVFAMASLIGTSSLGAQTSTMAGRVTDSDTGQPISSVQIFIEALELGTLTQASGAYILQNVPAGTQAVTVQRLGYREATATVQFVAGQTMTMNFAIAEQALQLDEIIVTGTPGGTQRRALGNVVSRVDAASIDAAPVQGMEELLASRIPGVMVHVGSGALGVEGGAIRIRGSSSIGLSNAPIIYIDGRRMNAERSFKAGTTGTGAYSRLDDINPADIESIEIIKGPAAATLYGTEASNGVIQIITKRGVSGATRFDASVELGRNWIPGVHREFNTPRIWGTDAAGNLITMHLYTIEAARLAAGGVESLVHDDPGSGLGAAYGGPLFQDGLIQRYSLSARGGSDELQYFASVNRVDSEGFVAWNTDVQTSGRLNVTTTIGDNLSIDLSSSYLKRDTRHPGNLWAEFRRGRVSTAGDIGGNNPNVRRGYGVAPFEIWRDAFFETNDVERSSWGLTMNYNPISWLTARGTFGNDVSEEIRSVFQKKLGVPFDAASSGYELGRKDIDLLKIVNRTLDLSASATSQLTDNIGGVTSVGLQYYQKTNWDLRIDGDEFATGALSTVGGTAIRDSDENRFENATVGGYVQHQFDWQQRIFLTAAMRADDNSAFGQDFDYVYYPKFSGAWVTSEESFWNVDLVNELRLRTAWGKAGQQPDVFAATRLFEARAGTANASYITPIQIGNPDLGPEIGQEFEVGVDLAAYDDRIGIEFTYYTKKTKDAIVNTPVAPSLGFPGFRFVNIGQVSNWGYELAVDLRLLQTNSLRADLGVAWATMFSRIDDMGGISEIVIRRTKRHVEGFPLAAQFERLVVSADWLDPANPTGRVVNAMCDGGTGYLGREIGGAPEPCDTAPRVWWGRQAEPTWTLQAFPSLTINNSWRVSALFYAQGGNMFGSDALYNAEIAWRNTRKANVLDELLYVAQRSVAPPAMGYYDGGYAKLREVSVSYTLPADMAASLGMSAASLTLAGRNLMLLWQEQRFSYLNEQAVGDPERNSIAATGPNEGHFTGEPTSGTMPPASHITVTARVSF